jgi:hypothetical protein
MQSSFVSGAVSDWPSGQIQATAPTLPIGLESGPSRMQRNEVTGGFEVSACIPCLTYVDAGDSILDHHMGRPLLHSPSEAHSPPFYDVVSLDCGFTSSFRPRAN